MNQHTNNKMKKYLDSTKKYGLFCILSLFLLTFAASCKKDKTEPIPEPLKISDYYPNSGNQGTLVTVQGTGFGSRLEDVSASFSGTQADVVSTTPTEIVLRSPANGQSGDIVLKVRGQELPVGKYTYQTLSVQEVSPSNGAAGTHIRISGAGFGSLKGPAKVFINGKEAIVVSAGDNVLVAEVPQDAGSGAVTVKVDGKEAAGRIFKYQAITAIKPLTGGKGTRVRISGEGFDELAAGNYVDFNGKQAVVEEVGTDHLIVIAPDEVKTGPLSVTINQQKVTGPVFTVVPLPVINDISPLSGPAGSVMTINGSNFSTLKEENKVTINGKTLEILTANAFKLTLTIPGGTGNGNVVLSVNDQVVQGPEFKDQSLGILKLSPDNGLAGTVVTITGSGFDTDAAANVVTFNGVTAKVNSATENTLVVVAPAGLSTGIVKVSTKGQTANSPGNFNRAGVVTLAGGPGVNSLSISRFGGGMAVDRQGNVFVIEIEHNRIKKISPQGAVSLFAGSPDGQAGNKNGQGSEALFNFSPSAGMVIDGQDNVYVTDYPNGSIRKITPSGVVSNFAVNLGVITKLTIGADGIMYVQRGFSGVYRIEPSGARTTLPQLYSTKDDAQPALVGNSLFFIDPEGIMIGKYDLTTLSSLRGWVGGSYGYQDGTGTGTSFTIIRGLVHDGQGNLYLTDNTNNAIRKVNTNNREVTTVCKNAKGFKDGSLAEAQFNDMADTAMDKDGNLYVLDIQNNAVRKVLLK